MMVQAVDERITKYSKIGMWILLGWFGSSAYHATLDSAKAVKAIPVLQAQIGCEHYLSRKAVDIAKQAIIAANSENAAPPTLKAIPQDNCPHPTKASP